MVETIFDLNLYEIPLNKALKYHRVFYGLWRRSDDQTTTWLKRVQNCIRHCQYPTITMEFLLFDRFICGLTANELKSIQSVKKSWSLKQLMEHFSNESNDIGYKDLANSVIDHHNISQMENITIDVMKSEPIEVECLSNNSFEEYADEDDALFSDIEETNSNQAMDEEYTDQEKDEYEYSVSNFATCEIDGDIRSQLDCPNEETANVNHEKNSNASNINDGKSFTCNQCDKSFCHLRNLIKHKNAIHRNIRPFTCEQCGKSFTTFQYLNEHLRIHTGEKPYSCDQCDKSFVQHSTLMSHKRAVHQRDRPFGCQQCDKCFVSTYELKRHSITHTGEKPYSCDQCDKSFALSSTLSNHKKNVHPKNRPFICDQCGKCFVLARDLKNHSFTHSGVRPFACDECDKSFIRACLLDHHKKAVHQLIRPFSCQQCNKCFTSAGDLKKHSKIHDRASVKKENSLMQN